MIWRGLKVAIEFNPNVQGFEALFQRMEELREEIGTGKTDKIWRSCLTYAMEIVLQDAIANAPFDAKSKDGHIRDHIYLKVQKPQARDKASSSYQGEMYLARVSASPIRDSTVYNTILNKKGRFQTVTSGKKPVGVSQEFGNARVPAKPFMRPALLNNTDEVQGRLGVALMAQIAKLAEHKG